MRIARWIIGGLLAALLLAGLTVLIVTVVVDPNRYRGQIERAVTAVTGQPFKIAGDLHISWFPWLALKMGPAQFGKPVGADTPPILRWQSARVGARLIPLLKGQLLISGIGLDSPRIYLKRSADGTANWDDLLKAAKSKGMAGAPRTGPGPRIGGVQIRDGMLTYVDDRSGREYTLSGWQLDVGEWQSGATFPVETRFALRARQQPVAEDLRLSARVHVSEDANDIDLFGVELSSLVKGGPLPPQGVPVELQVSRLAARLAPLDIAVSELSGLIAGARLSMSIQAGETGTDKAHYARGPLSLQIPSVRDFLEALGVDLPLPLDKGTLGRLSLTSRVAWENGAVNVNPLDFQLDDTHFNGEASRSNAADAVWTFALHGDKIGLSRYVDLEDKNPEPFELPVAKLKALQVKGELTFEQAWLAKAEMKNVRLRIELADGALKSVSK